MPPNGISSYRVSVIGNNHMVVSGHYLAAIAGYRILEAGGNAIDAGVASGIAINVTLPHATNFGGVAPIMIYMAETNEVVTISGLGRWPRAANIEYFMKNTGGEIPLGIERSVTPGAPDAWLTALEKYGTMTFEQVIKPALELAEDGFPVSSVVANFIGRSEETGEGDIRDWKSTTSIFMPNGRAPRPGEPLVQSDLAKTYVALGQHEEARSALNRVLASTHLSEEMEEELRELLHDLDGSEEQKSN